MNSLASTLLPFGIEITRHKKSGSSRLIEISARPESARRIAPIAPNAPNAAAAAENVTTDCATTRPIAPGASESGGGTGRNGRNSTASFRETDEGATLPPATSNATGRHSWAGWARVSVRSCCMARRTFIIDVLAHCSPIASHQKLAKTIDDEQGRRRGRAMVITNGIEHAFRYFHVIRN